MHKHPELTEARLKLAIKRRLKPLIHRQAHPVSMQAWAVGGEPVSYEQAAAANYAPFEVGQRWGGSWDTTWFHVRGQLPADWAGQQEVILRVSLGPNPTWGEGFTCEGLVWDDGTPGRAINVNRDDALRFTQVQGSETFDIYIEAAANIRPMNVAGRDWHLPRDYAGEKKFVFEKCELATFDREAWHLLVEFELLHGMLDVLPKDAPRRGQIVYTLNAALNALVDEDPATVGDARALLKPILDKRNGDTAHTVSAIGHAHIDTAWLWPLRETIRKCARTFSTALDYMDEYPDYVFGCSQPQQYAWMKACYPNIYKRIKAAVQRGQWQPMGSMWIEADCNISSGESLIRQILHGKAFFQDEFGIETTDVWIPDVFGYAAAMPQIMAKSGIDSFLTQKISWSQFNRFPHHTFNWRGIDGTEVFTHFPPADTYNGYFNPQEIAKCQTRFLDNDRATRSLYPYGYGDGGGGPTRQMLENATLMKDLEGLPRVELESITAFFDKAKADATDLPTWVGELYLEYHRGTYTTQGRTKRGNRKGEFALRDAEFFEVIDQRLIPCQNKPENSVLLKAPERAVYDVCEHPDAGRRRGHVGALDRAWKLILLNQFHDIIPGSSIHWVYEDAERDYQTVQDLAALVLDDTLGHMLRIVGAGDATQPLAVFNTLSHDRREVVDAPDGNAVLVQSPSCGYQVTDLAQPAQPEHAVRVDDTNDSITIDNGLLRIVIDKATGHLTSVQDHRVGGRETLSTLPGRDAIEANVLQLHPDTPNQWPAWDVDIFYREVVEDLRTLDHIEIIEASALRVKVKVSRSFSKTTIEQTIVICAESARIDFETRIDWHERHRLLKVAFPVAVRSEQATYEIQYGHVQRPTHFNTSWDMARFEVCGHKWADLSEGGPASAGGYGVALLNDCKYGHDIHDHVMRLSLLRGPIEPDPVADEGEHVFTYSLLPHPGDFREAGVIEQAYDLNVPLLTRDIPAGREGASAQSWFAVDHPGVVIEAVKPAEDGQGVIVRLYEAFGSRRSAALTTTLPFTHVQWVDMLERPEGEPTQIDGGIALDFGPFEIKTVKLV